MDIEIEEWLELDLKYTRESSIINDWKITFRTFCAVMGMSGEKSEFV